MEVVKIWHNMFIELNSESFFIKNSLAYRCQFPNLPTHNSVTSVLSITSFLPTSSINEHYLNVTFNFYDIVYLQ